MIHNGSNIQESNAKILDIRSIGVEFKVKDRLLRKPQVFTVQKLFQDILYSFYYATHEGAHRECIQNNAVTLMGK